LEKRDLVATDRLRGHRKGPSRQRQSKAGSSAGPEQHKGAEGHKFLKALQVQGPFQGIYVKKCWSGNEGEQGAIAKPIAEK